MTPLLLLIFGALSGSFLAILVGLVGAHRRIGFGWAFLLSLIFTPIIGLIITLISSPLPNYGSRHYGCIGYLLGFVGFISLTLFLYVIWAIVMGGLLLML